MASVLLYMYSNKLPSQLVVDICFRLKLSYCQCQVGHRPSSANFLLLYATVDVVISGLYVTYVTLTEMLKLLNHADIYDPATTDGSRGRGNPAIDILYIGLDSPSSITPTL